MSASQELHPHELTAPQAQAPNMSLEHSELNATPGAFAPDALSASHLSASAYASSSPQFSIASQQFGAPQDMSLMSPEKRSMDPSLSFFRPMPMQPTTSAPSAVEAMPVSQAQPMFGAPPLAVQADKTAQLQGSQLGGTAWLGLGGAGRPSIAGDSGGGGELNILSEFLESLDDSAPWLNAEKAEPRMTQSADAVFAYKPETPSGMHPGLQRASSSTLLNTPPSLVDQDALHLDTDAPALGETSQGLALLSPQQSMSLRNAPASPYRYGRKRPASEPGEHDAENGLVSMAADTYPASTTSLLESDEKKESAPYLPAIGGDASKTERFLLTAADQSDGSRDERLRKVIQAKCEAGLLRPYNHVNGYARLNKWMEHNVSASSRRRILKPLSVFRPVFYSIAKKLTNYDLIYIEEAFERLLLDYDRVFSIQSVPACLWRRTGEIYKGNKEFAELVGVSIESLREGRLCIYELMAEESAVNYWEKYGSVSFDPSQKAVLTMCKLRTKNKVLAQADVAAQNPDPDADEEKTDSSASPGHAPEPRKPVPYITCCFSFTIRRDKWNVRIATTHPDPYHDCWRTSPRSPRTFCPRTQRSVTNSAERRRASICRVSARMATQGAFLANHVFILHMQ